MSATSFVSQNNQAAAFITTMPAHQANDYILMFGFRSGAAGLPTLPAGWTDIINDTRTLIGARVGYKVAASSSETSGTWTNADFLICQVYRGVTGIGTSTTSKGSSTTVALPALTPNVADGSSWVNAFAGIANATGSLGTAPAGMTNRSTLDGLIDGAGFDTNGGVTSWAGGNITHTNSGEWMTFAVELLGLFDNTGQFFQLL